MGKTESIMEKAMMKRFKILCITLCLISNVVSANVSTNVFKSGQFGSSEVIEGSLSGLTDCLEYCVTGVCIWLVCTIYECHLEYTAQIAHNLPDLVVSNYPHPGDNSYTEARSAYGSAVKTVLQLQMGLLGGFLVGSGDDVNQKKNRSNVSRDTKRSTAIMFKETSVIGNPGLKQVVRAAQTATNGYICPTDTSSFFPYFHSEVDGIAWRTGLSELIYPNTYNPLGRVIGTIGINYWGRVHPRQGFLHQRNEAKSAGVSAVRAVDITTRDKQAHIYRKAPLPPSHEDQRRWQLISPVAENFCRVMGEDIKFGYGAQKSSDRKYGWLYWGRHQCCVPNPGILIAVIPTTPICL